MPQICSGLDGKDFNTIRELINTRSICFIQHKYFLIHIDIKKVHLRDNASVLAQIDESVSVTYQTVHSDEENKINNITFKDTYINVGKNQIIMSIHEHDTH